MQETEETLTYNTPAILALLALEPTGPGRYRGASHYMGSPNIFGGQLVAQALKASAEGTEGRYPHSLHANFVEPGDVTLPVDYEVEHTRNGQSFACRRVVARQGKRVIFVMTASFHRDEDGLSHHANMPPVQQPTALRSSPPPWRQRHRRKDFSRHAAPVEFRADLSAVPDCVTLPHQRIWLRAPQQIDDAFLTHACLFAYASDYGLLWTSMQVHGIAVDDTRFHSASLDHAIWFHRPFRIDDWLLHAMESPSAAGGRGLNLGHVFDLGGTMVATVMQESLMRLPPGQADRHGMKHAAEFQ